MFWFNKSIIDKNARYTQFQNWSLHSITAKMTSWIKCKILVVLYSATSMHCVVVSL
jgi:hypothetical protein